MGFVAWATSGDASEASYEESEVMSGERFPKDVKSLEMLEPSLRLNTARKSPEAPTQLINLQGSASGSLVS